MPNFVPIQDLTRQVELTDQMIIPISDGEESFAVTVEAFKFFVQANAEGMQAVVAAIDALKAAVGSPLVANTAADMTDEEKVYVYTGSETGYTAGHWYYYDGSAWQDGGIYNSAGVETDKNLSAPDVPADAAAVGEKNLKFKNDIDALSIGVTVDGFLNRNGIVIGGYGPTGSNTTNQLRARTGATKISATAVWKFYLDNPAYQIVNGFKYPASGSLANAVRITPAGNMGPSDYAIVEYDEANPWVRFSFKRTDDTNEDPMSSNDFDNIYSAFKAVKYVDDALSEFGVPADAEAVGKKFEAISKTYLKYIYIDESAATETYGGLMSNLPANSYSWVMASWFDDGPDTTAAGWVFTFSPYHTQGVVPSYGMQTYQRTNGVTYRRRVISNAWGDWDNQTVSTPLEYRGSISDAFGDNADVNEIEEDGIWYGKTPNSFQNLPFSGQPFHLSVYVDKNVCTHTIVSMLTGITYIRYKVGSGSWNKWKSSDLRDYSATYYAFGDSTTFGQQADRTSAYGASKYNYPDCVGRYLHMRVENKGGPGQGLLKDWDDIQTDFIENLDMSDAKLITVAWAYNDNSRWAQKNMGAYTDKTTDTVVGCYYTIMKDFQMKCPTAAVILITGFGSTVTNKMFTANYTFLDGTHTVAEFYEELEKMANLNGWCCINQAKGCWVSDANRNQYFGNDKIHPTNEGYLKYSQYMTAKISALYSNLASF